MLLKETEIAENFAAKGKFVEEKVTSKGETRAFVDLLRLDTLWFNTGTRCNLQCQNCYIESSPTNDELLFITYYDVLQYLDEIIELELGTSNISFTGGEPFLNKDILPILSLCLERGYKVLVLTNAYRAIDRYFDELIRLQSNYPEQLFLRVSLDHYTAEIHEQERGTKTFVRTLKTIKKLVDDGFNVSLAGRSLANESKNDALLGYQSTLESFKINLEVADGSNIVVFPEMSTTRDVPEITTACWDILGVFPEQQMCATERMIVKRKGSEHPIVLPCTLIAYDKAFEMGNTLKESFQRVYLNHPYCAQFCVLGGASCSV